MTLVMLTTTFAELIAHGRSRSVELRPAGGRGVGSLSFFLDRYCDDGPASKSPNWPVFSLRVEQESAACHISRNQTFNRIWFPGENMSVSSTVTSHGVLWSIEASESNVLRADDGPMLRKNSEGLRGDCRYGSSVGILIGLQHAGPSKHYQ